MRSAADFAKRILVSAAIAFAFAIGFSIDSARAADPASWEQRQKIAEARFAEISFAKALEIYREAPTNLTGSAARWVTFRLNDSLWRAQGQNVRNTESEKALDALEKAFPQDAPEALRDHTWAEAWESMGDFHRSHGDDRGVTETSYSHALNWWAGRSDTNAARLRYLGIIWKLASNPWNNQLQAFFPVSIDLLNNAVQIAATPEDKAHARYLRAINLRSIGPPDERALYLVEDDFKAALAFGKPSAWYDDALFAYANWIESQGKLVLPKNAPWYRAPEPSRALPVYKQLISEFKEGESRYWGQAKQQIAEIERESVSVGVSGVFLPGSEIQFSLNWRNTKRIAYALWPIDLTKQVDFSNPRDNEYEWVKHAHKKPGDTQPILRAEFVVPDDGTRTPGGTNIILTQKLKPGAYLVEVDSGNVRAQDIVLVTGASLAVRTVGSKVLALYADAITGEPIPEAAVHLWVHYWHPRGDPEWKSFERNAGADGVAQFEIGEEANECIAFARSDQQQAFSGGGSPSYQPPSAPWRLYVFTDRPAYRPHDVAHWKLIARREVDGQTVNPAGAKLYFDVTDPQGSRLTNGVVELNPFGSAWGDFSLGENTPLGQYSIHFWTKPKHADPVGSAVLFRLEEYKLPEFEVKVITPEEAAPGGGKRKKTFKLGESVEIAVQSDYYFGGPVANAQVEILVHQSVWNSIHPLERQYPWYYDSGDFGGGGMRWGRNRWRGEEQVVRRENLTTDANGRATLTLPTEAAGNDVEYRIEARVTDASRREISGEGNVRVTRQRYFVQVLPHSQLPAPESKITVGFKTYDANDAPVSVSGEVAISRERWEEIWIDPKGREVSGEELYKLKRPAPVWPPRPGDGERPWKLKYEGYIRDEIGTQTVKTGTNGLGELIFQAQKEGYYKLAWTSPGNATAAPPTDGRPRPFEPDVTGETTVWVCSPASRDLGYISGGVEIILDQDTVAVGRNTQVMLVCNSPDRYVLFATEVGTRFSYQMIHINGTAKIVEIPVTGDHVPNFWMSALSVFDRNVYEDTKEVIVPPRRQFITIDVKPDHDVYNARDEGSYTISTRDDTGQPVSAEVALSVMDESVAYIQHDLAGDPRPFFFGQKRQARGNASNSFQQRQYVRFVKDKKGELYDDRTDPDEGEQASVEEPEGMAIDPQTGMLVDTKTGRTVRNRSLQTNLSYFGFGGGGFGGAGGNVNSSLGWRRTPKNLTPLPAGAVATTATPRLMSKLAAASDSAGLGAMASDFGRPDLGEQPGAPVIVRSDFRATAFWQPDIITSSDGTAQIKLKYPDSLTRWQAKARAVSRENQVGDGICTARTRQPLMVRLQAPRFFTVGDLCAVSAVIENQTDQAITLRPQLECEGAVISGDWKDGQAVKAERGPITIAAHSETTVNWAVSADKPGSAKLRAVASTSTLGDAMEKVIPIYEHGIEKLEVAGGKAPSGDAGGVVALPKERKPGSTMLTVSVTPSLAATMLDALPYLADYPYGCTEQTLSRFLPAVIIRKTLQDQGLDAGDVMRHRFGGIETNFAAATHPNGPSDLANLDAMIKAGLDRLYDFQHTDGGWGWWKEGDSDHWMTAYVIWGWTLAQQAGVQLDEGRLHRGVEWLQNRIVEAETRPDLQAWMLYALSAHLAHANVETPKTVAAAFDNLWTRRTDLNAYTRALFAGSAHDLKKASETDVLLRNLENGVVNGFVQPWAGAPAAATTPQPTAHWGTEGLYYRWSEGGIEATAFALRALLAIKPDNALVEPVVTWLLKNRRGAQWNNTRDTAIVILALNDYLRATHEAKPDLEYAVEVNGQEIGRADLRGKPLWDIARQFAVSDALVRDQNEFHIRRLNGASPIYFNASARYFSQEEPITATGNEIYVRREYVRLVGRPTLLKGIVYDRVPLRDGESVKSGDRVEAVFTIAGRNHYEYLMFEDLKPAGLEAVEVQSGHSLYARELKKEAGAQSQDLRDSDSYTGVQRWVYPEWRDRKAALFVDQLPEGYWELRVQYRAERPGHFHALPLIGQAMYVPEIRANSAESRFVVAD